MKHIATMALMLNLGVGALYARERSVKMTFFGNFWSDRSQSAVPRHSC